MSILTIWCAWSKSCYYFILLSHIVDADTYCIILEHHFAFYFAVSLYCCWFDLWSRYLQRWRSHFWILFLTAVATGFLSLGSSGFLRGTLNFSLMRLCSCCYANVRKDFKADHSSLITSCQSVTTMVEGS